MAFYAATNKNKRKPIKSGKTQQQKREARKRKHNQMASEARKHKKMKEKKNKENHKFAPSLPNWPPQTKQYIEQQLKKYDYFKKRPHVYPCDDFESFVDKIIDLLTKRKGDFCWSMDWDPVFFAKLIYNGFLTIASEIQDDLWVMLPKLHEERCVIDLDPNSKDNNLPLIISKSAKKKSKNYTVTIDQCFQEIFQECINHHGLNWLYPPMQGVLYTIFHNRGDPNLNGVTAHSIEIWNKNGELVAGELGTSVGSIYTSLTGFYNESGCGNVQLLVLGHLLQKSNFLLWDLGMFIEYKSSLGAKLLKRSDFLAKYKVLRDIKTAKLECKEKTNCRDLVNQIVNKNNVNNTEQKSNDDGDEKMQSKDNESKPMSKNQQKKLAKLERRRLAKLKKKQEKEKKDKEAKPNGDTDDTKDVVMDNNDNNDTQRNDDTNTEQEK